MDSKLLAQNLGRTRSTINTEFREIAKRLGTHSRCEAIFVALRYGWVKLPPPEKPFLLHSVYEKEE